MSEQASNGVKIINCQSLPSSMTDTKSRSDRPNQEKEHWSDQLLNHQLSRVLIGASVGMLAAEIMIHHGGFSNFDQITTVLAGIVVWSAGLTVTIRPVHDIYSDLWSDIHAE